MNSREKIKLFLHYKSVLKPLAVIFRLYPEVMLCRILFEFQAEE